MEKIEAIFKPYKLDEVKENLVVMGIHGATVTQVRGHDMQSAKEKAYRGSPYGVEFLPMIRLEVVVTAEQKATAIAAILSVAKTGRAGDGRIFVSPLDDAIRIRTEEHGSKAL